MSGTILQRLVVAGPRPPPAAAHCLACLPHLLTYSFLQPTNPLLPPPPPLPIRAGSYSSNVNLAVENSSWSDEQQLQEMYLSRKSFAFNSDRPGAGGEMNR